MMSEDGLRCMTPASFWAPRHMMRSAWLEHAPFAFWLVQSLRPGVLVELGTHYGFSYLAFCQAVSQLGLPTRCHAIDTWEGDDHTGYYGQEVFEHLYAINDQSYGPFSRLMRVRFSQALAEFQNEEIDLLHIDGRHLYEDVLEDFMNWQPKLSAHAVVLFHDTNVLDRDFGVWKLWRELSAKFPSFEFPHGNGLGVLGVGRSLPDAVRPLFSCGPAEAAAIRAAYARLGAAVTYQSVSINAQSAIDQLRSEVNARGAFIDQLQRGGAASQNFVTIP
jgi:hypothetical protein